MGIIFRKDDYLLTPLRIAQSVGASGLKREVREFNSPTEP